MQPGFLVLQDGRRLPARDGLTMGRHAQCDIVIEDTKASRRHARLVVQGSVVEIEDLDSSNGTYLNGTQVRRRLLRDGDEVRIGLTSIVYAEGAADAAVEPEASASPAPASAPASPAAEDDDLLELEFDDEPSAAPISAPDAHEPGGGLEGDPLTNPPPRAAAPAPTSPLPSAPAPSSTPPPRDDVEVLEFVDEVVEVKKAPPRPEPRPSAAASSAPATRTTANRPHGVLQYSKTANKRGLLGDDMAQMAAWKRWGLIVLAVAAAAGVGYGVMQFVA